MSDFETDVFLDSCQLYDTLVNSAFGNKTIHCHLSRLAKTMSPIHCLGVIGWIPIVVVENDSVSCCEIDSETTSPCRKQKDKYIWPEDNVLANHVKEHDVISKYHKPGLPVNYHIPAILQFR